MKKYVAIAGLACLSAATLVACGGGGGSSGPDATMRFALTDAPACGFDHVWVTVERVGVHMSSTAGDSDSGWQEVTLSAPRRLDLLSLTNGVLEELGTIPLSSGHYSQVRLILSSNTGSGASSTANAVQPTGAATTPLSTPSSQQSGLKLKASFDVAPGQLADVVLDFDACKSVVLAGNSGQYILKPVVSVVPRVVAGVRGFIGTAMPLSSTTVAAQQNGTTVRATTPDSTGAFSIPYLAAGTYTVVITAPGHSTGVVGGVIVGADTTTVNGTSTAIVTPVSTMATVSGTVTATGNSLVTDATATASQTLASGSNVQVSSQAVNSTLATYSFQLPTGAPVTTTWSAASLPAFSADTAAAGKYSISVQAPSRSQQTKPADVSSTSTATVNFGY